MIDIEKIKRENTIVDVITRDLGKPIKQSPGKFFWKCPFHTDKNPSLMATPHNNFFHCFGCNKHGDVIQWVQEFHKMDFKPACEKLTKGNLPHINQPTNKIGPQIVEKSPPDILQESWKQIILSSEKTLWGDEGIEGREYLHNRGLTDETLKNPHFRIGYTLGGVIGQTKVESGIVIPCISLDTTNSIEYVNYIRVRQLNAEPKYKKLFSDNCKTDGLFGAGLLLGKKIIFLTEGEFDAMLLQQEAGNLIGVATLGSASGSLDFSRFGKYMIGATNIVVTYDNDDAGKKGSEVWGGLSPRVRVEYVPNGKDITDYYFAGGNLRKWVEKIIKTIDNQD